jgi:hypothetical protein
LRGEVRRQKIHEYKRMLFNFGKSSGSENIIGAIKVTIKTIIPNPEERTIHREGREHKLVL